MNVGTRTQLDAQLNEASSIDSTRWTSQYGEDQGAGRDHEGGGSEAAVRIDTSLHPFGDGRTRCIRIIEPSSGLSEQGAARSVWRKIGYGHKSITSRWQLNIVCGAAWRL